MQSQLQSTLQFNKKQSTKQIWASGLQVRNHLPKAPSYYVCSSVVRPDLETNRLLNPFWLWLPLSLLPELKQRPSLLLSKSRRL